MIGDRLMMQRLTRAAVLLVVVCFLLGLTTAGILEQSPENIIKAGKELGDTNCNQFMGIALITETIALVAILGFMLRVMFCGTLAKVADGLVAAEAHRLDDIQQRDQMRGAIEYCERHSGKAKAVLHAREISRGTG